MHIYIYIYSIYRLYMLGMSPICRAVVELAGNILNWEPPIGEKGIPDIMRLELIKWMVQLSNFTRCPKGPKPKAYTGYMI